MKELSMQSKKKASSRDQKEDKDSRNDPHVALYLRMLEHPLKKELALIRKDILGCSSEIQEGIKWNAPSFRIKDWFATANVREKGSLRIILHNGAKAKSTAKTGLKVEDPCGLLKCLGKDRCLVTFESAADVKAKRSAFRAVVKAWILLV